MANESDIWWKFNCLDFRVVKGIVLYPGDFGLGKIKWLNDFGFIKSVRFNFF